MAFLSINGWTIEVANDSASRAKIYQMSGSSTTWDNKTRRERASISREWSGDAPFLSEEEAETLHGLVQGLGHRFNFDGHAFSFDGLGPSADAGATFTPKELATSAPFSGLGELAAPASPGISWDPEFGDNWTVMLWNLLSPEHQVLRSDGGKWFDGVRNDAGTVTGVDVTDGVVTLTGIDASDLVLLPFAACDAFIEAFYAYAVANSEGFSDLPRLKVTGDSIYTSQTEVVGDDGDHRFVQRGAKTGETAGWRNNTRTIPFTLQQVYPPTRKRVLESMLHFAMDTDYINTDLEPVRGNGDATLNGTIVTGQAGPFGFGESFLFDGATEWLDLTSRITRLLGGSKGCTVLMWAKRGATATEQVLLELALSSTTSEKVSLKIDATDHIVMGGRSKSADSFQSETSAATYTDTSGFHLFGGYLDVENDSIGLIYDGEIVDTAAATFGDAYFVNDYGTNHRIGRGIGAAASNYWNGHIATCIICPKVLPIHLIRKVFDLGTEGVFR